MPTVWIPPLIRDLTGGREQVTVPGATVGEVVEHLDEAYPGIKERLCDAGRLRPGISVSVDGELSPRGLRQPVGESGEVHFLPSISGG